MPIYGIPGNLLGLTCSGFGYGRTSTPATVGALNSVQFTYLLPSSRRRPKSLVNGNLKVWSMGQKAPDSDWTSEAVLQTFSSDLALVFQEYDLTAEEWAEISNPRFVEHQVLIAHHPFRGGLLLWQKPWDVTIFVFEQTSQASRVGGKTFGLSVAEVLHLLEHLVIVNEQTGLLLHYQEEWKQHHVRGKDGYI